MPCSTTIISLPSRAKALKIKESFLKGQEVEHAGKVFCPVSSGESYFHQIRSRWGWILIGNVPEGTRNYLARSLHKQISSWRKMLFSSTGWSFSGSGRSWAGSSLLTSRGTARAEKLWEKTRVAGGAPRNTISVRTDRRRQARDSGQKMIWTRRLKLGPWNHIQRRRWWSEAVFKAIGKEACIATTLVDIYNVFSSAF